MKRALSIIVLLLPLISCSEKLEENGFDTACDIFAEASQKNLSPEELGKYIEDELKAMPDQKYKEEVIGLYDAIFQVEPSQRRQVFRESVELTLKREWHCEALKILR